jgi:Nucleotidyl transferase AbiEii toxin, Type IV TA system
LWRPLDLARSIGDVFDALGIEWVLGGSLASSLAGEPRATMDIDVAVSMSLRDVTPLVDAVRERFYVSEEMVRDAVIRHGSFNLLHWGSTFKIDVFVLGDDELDRRQIGRRQIVHVLLGDRDIELWVGTPEDQVLRKLQWFRDGGGVSERQWRDVVALLRVQGDRIDRAELSAAARRVEVDQLLSAALDEAASG